MASGNDLCLCETLKPLACMVLYLIYECVSMVNRLMIYVYRLSYALWKTGQGSKPVLGESKLENVLVMKIKYNGNRIQTGSWKVLMMLL